MTVDRHGRYVAFGIVRDGEMDGVSVNEAAGYV